MYGRSNGNCSCGRCEECEFQREYDRDKRIGKLQESARFREAAKLVAGRTANRDVRLALIQRVHQDSLEAAIVRYMTKEALPDYYAAILQSPNCIDRLVEGILYKVCKIQPEQSLSEQIANLSSHLHHNLGRLSAYERVTQVQHFIHRNVDLHLGLGAARSMPVSAMRNTLSAARLHLSIVDVTDHRPGYLDYIDGLSIGAMNFEYDEPRPSTAPWGKRSWPRWRVRHLRPLSYYFPKEGRALIQKIKALNEQLPCEQFVNDALLLYASGQ